MLEALEDATKLTHLTSNDKDRGESCILSLHHHLACDSVYAMTCTLVGVSTSVFTRIARIARIVRSLYMLTTGRTAYTTAADVI